ncbi:MAG: HEPN domain-containing protein [Armatimonadota bacterium]|nr:HEPN domain-containing protein [Armatimonadota bacterium]
MPPERPAFGSPQQWMQYARADLAMARGPLPEYGMYETLCYHAQQAVEKSLKAILVAAGVDFPYTHNLQKLLDLLPADIPRSPEVDDSARLSAYAVTTRYPGEEEPLTEEDYREAVRLAEAVVRWAARYLGFDDSA